VNDLEGIDWDFLVKRHGEITAGMLHGINGQEKTELYGREFYIEALRRTFADRRCGVVGQASSADMVERVIATWKFNASQHERAAEDYKARWLRAEGDVRAEAFKEFADNLRQTAHSAKGKLRREERLAIADWLDGWSERERRRGGAA
jgi:hypothetical protein